MIMPKSTLNVITAVATVLGLASLVFARWGFGKKFDPHNKVKLIQAVVLCCWILGPPLWFLFQWVFYEPVTQFDFEHMKYGQELASKAWLALVTVLFGLYFGKDFVK
jgi:hypothetical protein